MTAIALPAVQLTRDIRDNPYAAFMTEELRSRVNELQAAENEGHWASIKNELQIAKATLMDCVQFYSAMTLLPLEKPDRMSIIMQAGQVLRDAIKEIGSLAHKAARIETEIKGKHDPAVTLQVIQTIVRSVDVQLREAEERGELRDADKMIEQITLAAGATLEMPMGASGPVGITPSTEDIVRDMINTIPHAG